MTRSAASRWSRSRFLRAAGAAAAVWPVASLAASADKMRTRKIPSSGESLAIMGLGTARAFDVPSDPTVLAGLDEVLRLFFHCGGQMIDSSPMYGEAEQVVGDLLRKARYRKTPFYATKVWTTGRKRGVAQMDTSIRRMGSGTMDLIQIHNLQDWKTHLATLREWKAAGKIRYTGITHWRKRALPDLERIINSESIDFVQLPYSAKMRAAESRLLPLCRDRGVAVIVNRPFEGGDLFRAASGRKLPPWAADHDIHSWGQMFLKFVLGHPAVTVAIPATSKPKHMRDNMAAGFGALPNQATRDRIAALVEGL